MTSYPTLKYPFNHVEWLRFLGGFLEVFQILRSRRDATEELLQRNSDNSTLTNKKYAFRCTWMFRADKPTAQLRP